VVWAALSVARGELPDASKTPCHRRTLMLPSERVKLYSSISQAIVTQKLSDVATCYMVPAHPEDTVSETTKFEGVSEYPGINRTNLNLIEKLRADPHRPPVAYPDSRCVIAGASSQ